MSESGHKSGVVGVGGGDASSHAEALALARRVGAWLADDEADRFADFEEATSDWVAARGAGGDPVVRCHWHGDAVAERNRPFRYGYDEDGYRLQKPGCGFGRWQSSSGSSSRGSTGNNGSIYSWKTPSFNLRARAAAAAAAAVHWGATRLRVIGNVPLGEAAMQAACASQAESCGSSDSSKAVLRTAGDPVSGGGRWVGRKRIQGILGARSHCTHCRHERGTAPTLSTRFCNVERP